MDFRHLETFLWVTRVGNFGAAAEHLNTTQPAISRRIKQLEDSLGVKLFQGNTRNMRLTSKGRDLIDYAAEAVALMNRIREEVGQQERITGLLRIGATDIIAHAWLPEMVSEIQSTYPNLGIEVDVDLTTNLRTSLDRGELDIAILFGPVEAGHLICRSLGSVDVAWMACPDLELPEGTLTPPELAAFPVISHTKGTDHYHLMRNWFLNANTKPPLFNSCNSLSMLIRLTQSGLGSSILPIGLVQEQLDMGRLRIIKTTPPIEPNQFEAVRAIDSPHGIDKSIVEMAANYAAAHPIFNSDPAKTD
jgi:DNA-binding transcriptional LysR family regulator